MNNRRNYIVRITTGYAIISTLWILLSDQLLSLPASNTASIWLSTIKGLLFVLVTTVLLYFALHSVAGKEDEERAAVAGAEAGDAVGGLSEGVIPIPRWLGYVLAVIVTAGVLQFRMNLNVEFGNRPLLILFMTPVILSALLGGLGPGLASTAIAATGIYFFYLPSFATLVKFKQHDLFQWCMLIVNGVSVSVLSEVLLRERARAKRSEERWTFALEGSGDGVWDWNALTNEVFYSRQWKAMLGYAEHEITNTLEEWERRVHPDDREQVQRNLTSHLEGLTDTYRSEHRMLCKDGSYKWILDRGKVISRTAEGKPLRVIGTHADISARKEAETRYHLLFDHSPDGIVVLDPETGGMLGFNEAASRQLGYSREEFARLNVSDIDASETSEETSNRMKKVMIDGRDDFETRHRTRGGEIRIVHVTAQFTRILGHPLYHCVWRDITERKQTEVNLRTSVQMWDNTFNAMHDAVSIMDEKGFIVRCNKAMLDLLGVSDQDISGRPCWEVVHSTNDRIENCPFEKMLRSHTRETLTAEMYGRWFSVTVDPIMNESGAITGGIHIIRDFTERKQAEEALMASEEQYRVLFEKSHDAIMVFAPHDNRFIKANAATARMFKAKDELAFTAYTPWDISPERQPDGQLSSVKALVMIETALREGSVFFEWTHKRLNGEIFPATVLLNPIEISGEKLIQATVRDITEQARIMVALRESEEMVSLILNSASEGICGIDTDGNCMFCNAAGLRMLGYAQERDLIGRNMHSLIHHTTEHGQVHSPENCIFRQSIQQEESLHSADETLWKSDGTGFHAEFWSHPLKKNGRNIGAVITFIDVSQRISLENQFRHAQKMEAIGLLAGGIAHDFNNVLTAIVGNAHLALMSMTPAADGRQYIDQVLESSHRAAALAQSLLAFSRKQAIRLEPLNLNEVIARFEKIMQRLIREDIELCTVFAPDVLSIMADRGQIEQIVMNLVTNARDAMPSGGRIGIQTKAVALDRTFLDAHRYGREGQYAVLSVTDTGIGMSKELQEKIFDPFFTTKEPGKGTGLGLSMVYGIVKKHNGFINVYSELKKGTTFNLYFPLAEKKAIAKIEVAPSRPSGGTETILLAEDNISVRQMITTALRNFGYRVIEAVDGTEVVKKFSENGRDVNLVLMDGIMPGLNGKEAFRKIRELRPDMRVLFMSGYPEDVFTVNGVPEKGIDFIQKPLSLVDLLRKIREELDRNNTAS